MKSTLLRIYTKGSDSVTKYHEQAHKENEKQWKSTESILFFDTKFQIDSLKRAAFIGNILIL